MEQWGRKRRKETDHPATKYTKQIKKAGYANFIAMFISWSSKYLIFNEACNNKLNAKYILTCEEPDHSKNCSLHLLLASHEKKFEGQWEIFLLKILQKIKKEENKCFEKSVDEVTHLVPKLRHFRWPGTNFPVALTAA